MWSRVDGGTVSKAAAYVSTDGIRAADSPCPEGTCIRPAFVPRTGSTVNYVRVDPHLSKVAHVLLIKYFRAV